MCKTWEFEFSRQKISWIVSECLILSFSSLEFPDKRQSVRQICLDTFHDCETMAIGIYHLVLVFAQAAILKSFKFGQRLEFIHFRLILQTCQVKEVTSFKKGWENEIQNTFKLHNGQKYIFTLLFFGCFETRWNSLKKEVVCIVIVKRKNGKWKCKLSFDGLGLLKYGLLFPRSFSKLSFVTEAAHY